jgi:hypothetical protein
MLESWSLSLRSVYQGMVKDSLAISIIPQWEESFRVSLSLSLRIAPMISQFQLMYGVRSTLKQLLSKVARPVSLQVPRFRRTHCERGPYRAWIRVQN